MTEKIQIGNWCTLYHGDGADMLNILKEHNPAAVITDPPYGLNYVHPGGVKGKGFALDKVISNMEIAGDNEGVDITVWLWCDQILFFGADHLREYLPKGGRFIAWDKVCGHKWGNKFSDVEFAWHSKSGKSDIISHLWKGAIRDKTGGDQEPRFHPMQKPIKVMEWCIDQCKLKEGSMVLDPYMGSGTTGIAAFKKNMQFVGVDIDKHWFNVAAERIKKKTSSGPLLEQLEPNQLQFL